MQHASLTQFLPAKPVYTDIEELLRCRYLAQSLTLSPYLAKSKLSGGHKSRQFGRGLEFEELRLYQAGDDIRTIDWRVTAKTGQTHTKLYGEEREIPVVNIVDQRPTMFFGSQQCMKSVMACHIAALLSWQSIQNGDRIGGLVFNDISSTYIEPKRNRSHVMRLLSTMSTYNNELKIRSSSNTFSLVSALRSVANQKKHGLKLNIISDFNDEFSTVSGLLNSLSAHNLINLFQISDPLEDTSTLPADTAISDGDKLYRINNKDIAQHLKYRRANLNTYRSWALNRNMGYQQVITNNSPESWLGSLS